MKLTANNKALPLTKENAPPIHHIQAGEFRFELSSDKEQLDIIHQLKTSGGTVIVNESGLVGSTRPKATMVVAGDGTLEGGGIPSSTVDTASWYSGTPSSYPYTVSFSFQVQTQSSASYWTFSTPDTTITSAADTAIASVQGINTATGGVTGTVTANISSANGSGTVSATMQVQLTTTSGGGGGGPPGPLN